jgi:hypothetical protein
MFRRRLIAFVTPAIFYISMVVFYQQHSFFGGLASLVVKFNQYFLIVPVGCMVVLTSGIFFIRHKMELADKDGQLPRSLKEVLNKLSIEKNAPISVVYLYTFLDLGIHFLLGAAFAYPILALVGR